MRELSQIVDSLEDRISKLLHRYENVKAQHSQLEVELANERKAHLATKEVLQQWQEQFETLKTANAMLGSDQYKRETKLKINNLVREIDQCIVQLSE